MQSQTDELQKKKRANLPQQKIPQTNYPPYIAYPRLSMLVK